MNREFQQYRFALIEARNIARARLESQLNGEIVDVREGRATLNKSFGTDELRAMA